MECLKGTVSKIRIINPAQQRPLVRFTLSTADGKVNCLIAWHSLSFLADADEGMRLVIYGVYNQRSQFVAKKFNVLGKTRLMMEFETMKQAYM